jgi:Flp pilus assembly protein TadD
MPDFDLENSMRGAMALYRAGRQEDAIATLYGLASTAQHPKVYALLARLLVDAGRVDDAIAALRESTTVRRSVQTLSNLGLLLLGQDRSNEAIHALQEALVIDPGLPEALSNLGAALRKVGQAGEAIVVLQRAVTLHASFGSAWTNLAGAMIDLEMFTDAERAAHQATILSSNDPVAYFNLGVALKELGRLTEAVTSFESAISLRPNYVDALTSLGNSWHTQQKYDAAISAFRSALQTSPDDAYAQWNLSLTLLLRGEYAEAWPLYEARFQHAKHSVQRTIRQPRWDGGDLHGRRILLHYEQGLGDTLQFVRYAPLVAARGGRVTLLCQPALSRLLQGQCELELVTSDEQALPAFDVQVPLLSLPMIFKTTLESIPAPNSYLKADPSLISKWNERLGAKRGLRVGLNWAGSPTPASNRKRTVGFAAMAPLAEVEGLAFFGLQVGAVATEAATPPSGMTIFDCSAHLTDFAETAALISTLDVVVTCDTSVAHAAGALGVPTCVLLPSDPDWRWMLGRSDSPWYPSMRLFRQPTPGDYATPMREVAAYLKSFRDRV